MSSSPSDSLLLKLSTLSSLTSYQTDYSLLYDTLFTLPLKISYPIMVPLSPIAFSPGKLIHTNEVMVYVGEELFIEQTVSQSCEIINRRQNIIEKKIQVLNEEIVELKNLENINNQLVNLSKPYNHPNLYRLGVTPDNKPITDNTDPSDELVDIREPYEDEEEKLQTDVPEIIPDKDIEDVDFSKFMDDLLKFDSQVSKADKAIDETKVIRPTTPSSPSIINTENLPSARNESKRSVSFSDNASIHTIPNRKQAFAQSIINEKAPVQTKPIEKVESKRPAKVDTIPKVIERGMPINNVIERNPTKESIVLTSEAPKKVSRFKAERNK